MEFSLPEPPVYPASFAAIAEFWKAETRPRKHCDARDLADLTVMRREALAAAKEIRSIDTSGMSPSRAALFSDAAGRFAGFLFLTADPRLQEFADAGTARWETARAQYTREMAAARTDAAQQKILQLRDHREQLAYDLGRRLSDLASRYIDQRDADAAIEKAENDWRLAMLPPSLPPTLQPDPADPKPEVPMTRSGIPLYRDPDYCRDLLAWQKRQFERERAMLQQWEQGQQRQQTSAAAV